jgi:hypothetical protein
VGAAAAVVVDVVVEGTDTVVGILLQDQHPIALASVEEASSVVQEEEVEVENVIQHHRRCEIL